MSSRRRRIVAAAIAGLAAASLVGAGKASAHAELLASDPQPGAVLDTSPAKITLAFSEPVEISLGAIRLFDGSGHAVDIGKAQHPPNQDNAVEVSLPKLDNGSYVVDWRVVSADSHPVHAAFTFQVGPSSTLQTGLVDRIVSGTQTGGTAGGALGASRGLVIASMAIVFGGLLLGGMGVIELDALQRRVIGVAAAFGVVAGVLALPLEAGYASGGSLSVITDGAAWRAVWGTSIGTAWIARAAAIGVTAFALLLTAQRRRASWWIVTAMIGLVVAGVASAYGGHGAAGRWHYLGVFLTMLHVCAMAVWIGGLLMVLLSARTIDQRNVERFSAIALLAVATIVVSGVIQGFRQVERFDSLTSTTYGKLLIWKVVAVAAVLGVATVARRATHGRLLATAVPAATLGAAGVDSFDRPRLRKAITIEAALAVGVIVVTTFLMAANPAQATQTGPFSATVSSNGYLASISVVPAKVGMNEVHIYLSNPASSLTDADAVDVSIQDPSRGVDKIPLQVSKAGAGHWVNEAAWLPYAATWRLEIKARYGFDEITFTTDVPTT